MNRMTSDNTFEMDMHQLALNQVYIGEDGWAWYIKAPDEECRVSDLVLTAAETLNVELPILSDEALADLMTDFLPYGEEEPEGVLAILYRALYAMAEARNRLKRYEDTGLEPEEVAELQKLCEMYVEAGLDSRFIRVCMDLVKGGATIELLHKLVSNQGQLPAPNAPLTPEELREMDGDKIYIHYIDGFYTDEDGAYFGKFEQLVRECEGKLTACKLPLEYYGKTWLAYCRKLEAGNEG